MKKLKPGLLVVVLYFLLATTWVTLTNTLPLSGSYSDRAYHLTLDVFFIAISVGLLAIFISGLYKTKAKLRESESEIRGIFDGAQEAFCLIDDSLIILDFNKRFEMTYLAFYEKALVKGMNYLAIFPENEQDSISERLQNTIDGQAYDFERLAQNNGLELWVRVNYKPISNKNGKISRIIISVTDITSYKLALHDLDESYSKLEFIFNYSTDALFITDHNREFIIDCNATCLKLFEADNKAQIVGLRGLDLHAEEITHNIVENVSNNFKENSNESFEFKYKTFKGNTFWGILSGKIIETPNGIINLVRLIDISARKAAEQKINQVERKFRQLADSSPAMLWISSQNGKIIFYNQSWLDFRGINLIDEMDWGWKDSIHPDDYTKFIHEVYNPAIEKKTGYTTEYRLKRKDGEYRWILENTAPKFDFEGEFEGLFGSAIDITDRKAAELNLKNQEKFNSRISELSPDFIYIYDLSLRQNIYCNRSLVELLGYKLADYPNFNENVFLELIHPDDYEPVKYNEAYFARFNEQIFIDLEFRMKAPNGGWRWIHTRETIFSYNENGIPSQLLGNARDITEKKLTEQEIIQTNEELKIINEELDSFVYRASHDLRAPLSSVLGLINLAKVDIKDETSLFYFDMMQKSIQKLSDVTNDLIDHARNASMGMTIETIDFNTIINDIIDGMRFHENSPKIKFEVEVDNSHEFGTDKLRVILLFNNLITNAIKYHDISKQSPYLKIKINQLPQSAEIEVEDNGLGIEEEYQGKIFDMFFRVNKTVSGTGLGLYIVKGAVDKLKGKIRLVSKPKLGTTFYVALPNRISQ